MAAGKINLQANDGKILGLYAPDGMSANTDIVPANANGDATKVFKVANAVNPDEAVSKAQLDTSGIAIASTAQAQAGTDDTTAISPLKLAESLQGVNQSLVTNGYQKLHGGLIIQWGKFNPLTVNAITSITFPIAFPNAVLVASATPVSSSTNQYASAYTINGTTGLTITNNSSYVEISYMVIGY